METFEPQLLFTAEITETLSAGEKKTYKYGDYYWLRKIVGEEVAEITHMEVKPPEDETTLDPAGSFEMRFAIDGATPISDPAIFIRKDEHIAPIREKIVPQCRSLDFTAQPVEGFRFGVGLGDAMKNPEKYGVEVVGGELHIPNLLFTCPKFTKSVDVEVYVEEAVTKPFRINLWGYIYPKEVLAKITARIVPKEVVERHREKVTVVEKEMAVTFEDWTKLPGGHKQDAPRIYHFTRRFTNTAKADKNQIYRFSYTDRHVEEERYSVFWYAGEIENEIFVFNRVGFRYHPDIKYVAIMDKEGHLHPSRGLPIIAMGYGWGYGLAPGRDLPKDAVQAYYEVPEWYVPYAVGGAGDEEGGIVFEPTADITADQVKGVAIGKRIQLK